MTNGIPVPFCGDFTAHDPHLGCVGVTVIPINESTQPADFLLEKL